MVTCPMGGVDTCNLGQGSPLFATSLRPPSSVLGAQEILSPFFNFTHPHKQHWSVEG